MHFQGILALLVVTIVWGTTFPAMKDLSADFSAAWIVVLRFSLASLILFPFLFRAKLRDCAIGAMLGMVLFACYMFQVEGLALTSANRNAFITGLNVLVVPLLGVAMGTPPEKRIVVAIVLAIAGLFALCWDGGAWSVGDTLALGGAVCFGLYIKLMEVSTRKVERLMVLTTMQIVSVAACAALWLLLVETPGRPVDWTKMSAALSVHWPNVVYLGVVATAAIISLQTWGQRHASANEAAVIYAFEPGCAAIAAYFWLGETMAWRGMLGAALMIAGMIVSQWTPKARAGERHPLGPPGGIDLP